MVLLERDGELRRLRHALDEAGSSGGRVVLIRGEAGIGKSSLVRAFLDEISDSAHVHVGYCDDLDTPQPFGPLWDIARDEPELQRALLASDRQAILGAAFDLLTRSLRPAVAVIEDTQWSDEATLDAIRYVGRRIARTGSLLLLTYRDEEVDPDDPLRVVLGSLPPGHMDRIELEGLSRESVVEILAGSELDPDEVLEATGGNPFFVTEMALTTGDSVPASIRDAVLARVARLSIPARDMLRQMSVIPERTTRTELTPLVGNAEEEIAECERAGLLDVSGENVAFRHELIRRSIEQSLATIEAIEIHEKLLRILPEDTDPARLVHHARGSNDVPRLLQLAPKAARAAAGVASHREASAHYRAIQHHLERLPSQERARVFVDWALIEYYLANIEAIDILDKGIRLLRDEGNETELARALGIAVAVNETHGRTARAGESAKEAIEILERSGESRDLAEAYSRYADLLLHQGEGLLADDLVEKALAMSESTGSVPARIRALIVKGMLAYVRGEPGGRDLVEEARRIAEEGGYRYEEVTALRSLAYSGQEQDDIDLQADTAQRARASAIRYELSFLEAEANAVYADALARKGRWDAAEDLVTENIGSHVNADVHLLRLLGLLRLRKGQSGGADYLRSAWSMAEESGEIDYLLHVGAALAEERWLERQIDETLSHALCRLVIRGVEHEFPWLAGALAFWLWMLGVLEDVPAGLPAPHAQVISGNWEEAAAHWEDKDMPYERALVLSCGDKDARLSSLQILESLGADATAARVRRDLRDDGIAVPRGKGRATRRHAAGLTARQAEVLELLDLGMSNSEIADRLFLSPRTVENHVSAILAKLGCSTREEAVEIARSQGLIGAEV